MTQTTANWNFYDAYWLVGDHLANGVFSSGRNIYVPTTDASYLAWLAVYGAPLPIDTDANMRSMLGVRAPGFPNPGMISRGM